MTKSRKFGPIRVRAHKRNGVETGKWYVDVPASLTSNGKRRRRFFDNCKTAREIARRLSRDLDLRVFGLSRPSQVVGLTFRQAAGLWAADEDLRIRTRKKRQISLDTDQARLKAAIAFFGDQDLSLITDRRLAEFQAERLNQGRSPDTVNSDIKSVLKVLRWATRCKRLHQLPTVEPIPTEPPRFDPPTDEELACLIEACSRRHRELVWFLAETGCRTGEAFHLTWEDVDFSSGKIHIHSKNGWTPKTRQSTRDVFPSENFLAALSQLPKTSPYVFQRKKSERPPTNIRKAFASAAKRARLVKADGTPRITPHDLRRAFATRLVEAGIPQRILQANLGHAAGSPVTNRYYTAARESVRRAAFPPLPVKLGSTTKVAISGNSSLPLTSTTTGDGSN